MAVRDTMGVVVSAGGIAEGAVMGVAAMAAIAVINLYCGVAIG